MSQPQIDGMCKLLGYLYMSDADAADDEKELNRLGITHVINCESKDIEWDLEENENFTYLQIPAADRHDYPIGEHFDEVFNFIWECKGNDQKVLIFCGDGKHVAPVLAIAYIIKAAARAEKYLPLKAAVPHVKKAMVGTNPNDGFLVQLCKLEKDLWDEVTISVRGGHGGGRGRGRGGKGGRGRGGGSRRRGH